jgi:Fe-S cluster assembly ATP-binding protein
LELADGEIHAIMGPNGSGKSTLAYTLAGHPKYSVQKGKVLLGRKNILSMSADERARAGVFLAFQYPVEIGGVSVQNFLKAAYEARFGKVKSVLQFRKMLAGVWLKSWALKQS